MVRAGLLLSIPLGTEDAVAESSLVDLLRLRALRWLAQREHSEVELRRKLLRLAATNPLGLSEPAALAAVEGGVDGLIHWLRERHYLSDQRFIESRLRNRPIRWGVQRIQHELLQHGLSLGEAERQQLAQSELHRAHAVWARKFGPALPSAAAARATQGRFLMQRGFAVEVAMRVLRGEGAHQEPDGV